MTWYWWVVVVYGYILATFAARMLYLYVMDDKLCEACRMRRYQKIVLVSDDSYGFDEEPFAICDECEIVA